MGRTSPLTAVEKKRIEDMVHDKATDSDIAKAIGRNARTVKRYRDKIGLQKTGHGQLINDASKISDTNVLNEAKTEDEKLKNWIGYFKTGPRYKKLINELTEEDLEIFCSQWARYNTQFEDMKPSEEDTLELLITYQLRIRENRKSFKEANEKEAEYKRMLGGRGDDDLDLENESDRWIYEMVMSNNRNKQEINKELKDLQDRHDKLLESLNATRRQREEKHAIGKDTLIGLIKALNDRDRRVDLGTYNERMKAATISQTSKMKKAHKFVNGDIEPTLLDGADFVTKKIKDE